MTIESSTTDAAGVVAVEPRIPPSLIDETPVTPPVPATDDKKADEPAATDETAETPEQAEEKKQSRRQRQRERQLQELAAAKTEARMLREQLAQSQAKDAPAVVEPKREDYQDYESYLRAVAKHDAKQEAAELLKAERETQASKQTQQQGTPEQQKLAQDWMQREKAFAASKPDYLESVNAYLKTEIETLSDPVRAALAESGPEVLYHLAKNPDVAEALADMSPRRQIVELGKIEDELKKPPKAAKLVSDAPPPAKTVPQGKSATTGYSENMTDKQYEAWRKSQGAKWAR